MYPSRIKKNNLKIFLVISFFILSAFTLARKVEPIPNLPEGNSDPDVGIVIRFDSAAQDILADSSQTVRFNIIRRDKNNNIFAIMTPKSDFTPKKLVLEDSELGFVADMAHKVTLSFNWETQIWDTLEFYPFEPSRYKTAAEVLPILQQWVAKIDEAGWVRRRFIDGDDQRLPIKETVIPRNFLSWKNNNFKLALQVGRIDPRNTYKKMDEPGYYVRVELEKRRN